MSLLLASCDIETSDNGQLDGLWQMREIEDLQTGQTSDGRDVDAQWSFQGSLLMLHAATHARFNIVYCSFKHEGNRLQLSAPYFGGRFDPEFNDDVKVDNPEDLHIYGLYRLDEAFQVLQLDSKTMILQSDSVRLHFRKY